MRQGGLGSGFEGGVEQVALRARVHHETNKWLILPDCSNAFNTMKRAAVLTEAATCVPALTSLLANMLRREARPCIIANGFLGAAKYRMFEGSAERGRYGPGVVLHR